MSMLSLALQLQQRGDSRVRIPALKGTELKELLKFINLLKS